LDKCIGIEETRADRPPIRNIEAMPIAVASVRFLMNYAGSVRERKAAPFFGSQDPNHSEELIWARVFITLPEMIHQEPR
jgi:hypothetical protein